jgi:hypothetical protein
MWQLERVVGRDFYGGLRIAHYWPNCHSEPAVGRDRARGTTCKRSRGRLRDRRARNLSFILVVASSGLGSAVNSIGVLKSPERP